MCICVFVEVLKFPRQHDAEQISESAKDLIQRLLQFDPKTRICAPEIKRHLFFKKFHWDDLSLNEPPFIPNVDDVTDTSYFNSPSILKSNKIDDASGESIFLDQTAPSDLDDALNSLSVPNAGPRRKDSFVAGIKADIESPTAATGPEPISEQDALFQEYKYG